jgi:hypothetical protein
VRVALVRNVIDDFILGGVENAVESDCSFNHSEVGTEVTAVDTASFDEGGTHFIGKDFTLFAGQNFNVLG